MSAKKEIQGKGIPTAVTERPAEKANRRAAEADREAAVLREQAHNLSGGDAGLVKLAEELHTLGFALGVNSRSGNLTATGPRGQSNISAATPERLLEKARRRAAFLSRLGNSRGPAPSDYAHVGKAA